MPGASKRRGKVDRQNRGGSAQTPAPQPPPEPATYDGPSDPRLARPSNRGDRPANVPPNPSQPVAQSSSAAQPAHGASPSPSASGAAPAAARPIGRDPARALPVELNRNVDYPAGAYNHIYQVSGELVMPFVFSFMKPWIIKPSGLLCFHSLLHHASSSCVTCRFH